MHTFTISHLFICDKIHTYYFNCKS